MEFSGRFVYGLMHYASLIGADINALMALSGSNKTQLLDQDLLINADTYDKITMEILSSTGDRHFGLHAGEHLSLSSAGIVGQITQNAATIKEALEYAIAFANLSCRAIPKSLVWENDRYKILFNPTPLWLAQSVESVRQTIDGLMVFTLREFTNLTKQKYRPLSVSWAFPKPDNIAEYQRIFDCPLAFGQQETAMFFAKEQVETPILTSDYHLLRVLVDHAYERLEQFEHKNGFHQQVKQSVINMAAPTFPSVEQVAANFNMSVRSLQRRLGDEGHTFKSIVESLRQDFSYTYLKRKDISITEIAYLLNYADNSSFTRSFKRWTGLTPNQYRLTLERNANR
ncbi:MAG: AraC family transcriptional regulator ligand-binding domain-containing protein [Bacteroidota bacterium]